MTAHLTADISQYSSLTDLRHCPDCNATVEPTWRTPSDKLVHLLVPVQRYRCTQLPCRWEGVFRIRWQGLASLKSSATGEPSLDKG